MTEKGGLPKPEIPKRIKFTDWSRSFEEECVLLLFVCEFLFDDLTLKSNYSLAHLIHLFPHSLSSLTSLLWCSQPPSLSEVVYYFLSQSYLPMRHSGPLSICTHTHTHTHTHTPHFKTKIKQSLVFLLRLPIQLDSEGCLWASAQAIHDPY
jgi:hypothetical protein